METSNQAIKLTTRGRYAIMAMVELARMPQGTPVPLAEIAEKGNISLSYLEQLIAGLRKHDLVKSYRGPGGGYMIDRPLSEILVADILMAAEDSTPAKRSEQQKDRRDITCENTHALWDHIGELLHVTLRRISLEDVIQKRINNHPVSTKIFETFG